MLFSRVWAQNMKLTYFLLTANFIDKTNQRKKACAFQQKSYLSKAEKSLCELQG